MAEFEDEKEIAKAIDSAPNVNAIGLYAESNTLVYSEDWQAEAGHAVFLHRSRKNARFRAAVGQYRA